MPQEQPRPAQNRQQREDADRHGRDGRRFPVQVRPAFIRLPRPVAGAHR